MQDEHQQVQQALRESEERYRQLAELLPQAIAVVCQNRLVYINSIGVGLWGASSLEELLGKSSQQLGLPHLEQWRDRSLEDTVFTHLIRLDGTTVEIELQGSHCHYNCKPAIQWVGLQRSPESPGDRDRFERAKQLQQENRALRRELEERTAALIEASDRFVVEVVQRTLAEKSLQKHLTAIESSIDGIAILNRDREYLYLNQAYAELYGYECSRELLGQSWDLLYKDVDFTGFEQEIIQISEIGRWRGIAKGRRTDGTEFHQEISLTGVEYDNIICIVRDISDRINAEKELQKAKDRLEAVLNAIPGSVAWIDADLRYMGVNQYLARIFNLTPEDFVGREVGFLETSSGLGKFLREFFVSDNWQAAQEIETNYKGQSRSYLLVAQKYDKGKAAVSVGVEISEQKRLELELREALEKEKKIADLKSRFVTTTSHEFRTPLTTIHSSAELLEHYSDRFSEDKKLKHLHRIQGAVKRMTELLDDVLIVGKAEAGKLEFHPTEVDLEKFCREIVEEQQLSDNNKHELGFACTGGCDRTYLDPKLLRHIFCNLLSNALKYSEEGTTVNFTLFSQDNRAIVQIEDAGIGIPSEDQKYLFESFHRATNVGNISGTGLGLAIVKKAVEIQGGEISIESQVGVGTTVTVRFPLSDRSSDEKISPPTIEIRRKKVLFVEDNAIVRMAIAQALEKNGYQVQCLSEGSGFFSTLSAFQPDAIVMDLKLPDMDGMTLLEQLHRSQWAHLPAIIVSAFSFPSNEERSRLLGVRQFLPKPITHRELLRALEDELDGKD